MIIYGLKNCDSCRKAIKAFPQAQLVDVRTEGVPGEVLEKALEIFGEALLNTRSTTWRGLGEAERKMAPLALLKTHPTLMKRPLVSVGNQLFMSWNKDIEAKIKAVL